MAKREKTLKRHDDIRKDFEKMSNEKEYGVQKYNMKFILEKLGEKYYMSSKTIENIVFFRLEKQ
ncbi:hypothetical protein P3875_01245 [Myroides sp. JBRI-B21084]|uniref:hypothetical protein n=1 Tax=Myroides sp. JBRI-B21084 TaxID=3119977 RepID=UPI0026E12D08|nr:hypothetical protein [Paenimyroides cloacae]WKW46726.1 hypothetical protein P3875_01245 [Paenimyroides cloacae]